MQRDAVGSVEPLHGISPAGLGMAEPMQTPRETCSQEPRPQMDNIMGALRQLIAAEEEDVAPVGIGTLLELGEQSTVMNDAQPVRSTKAPAKLVRNRV